MKRFWGYVVSSNESLFPGWPDYPKALRILAAIILISFSAVLTTSKALASEENEQSENQPIQDHHAYQEIIDSSHAAIKPQRIVVFPIFAEEILMDLVDFERVVYVGHAYFENGEQYYPSMPLTKSCAGANWQNSNEDYIVSLEPDLIILPGHLSKIIENVFPKIAKGKFPILYVDVPQNIQEIQETIIVLGNAVGEAENAETIIKRMEDQLQAIEKAIENIPIEYQKKVVYLERFQDSFSMLCSSSALIDMNQEKYDYMTIDKSQIAAWNPHIIFYNPISIDTDGSILSISDAYANSIRQGIQNNQILKETEALKNNAVYPIHLHCSQYATQSILELIHYAYPELSIDIY